MEAIDPYKLYNKVFKTGDLKKDSLIFAQGYKQVIRCKSNFCVHLKAICPNKAFGTSF